MSVYFINLFFILVLGLLIFFTGSNNTKKKLYVVIAYTSIFLIAGLRNVNVGTDTVNYQQIFILISNLDITDIFGDLRIEPGYFILNKVLSLFTTEPSSITLLSSAIIVIGFAVFVYYNSENVTMSTFLFLTTFYFSTSLNASRQFIAVALLCNSFYFFKNGRTKLFIGIVVLASMFHLSSIVFLLVLVLKFIKPKPVNFIWIVLILFTLGFTFMYSNDIVMNLLSQYEVYKGTIYFEEQGVRGTIIIWICQICLALISIIILKINKKRLEKIENEELFYLSIFMILTVVIGMIGTKIFIFSRISYYFGAFMIILIPKILNKFDKFGIFLHLLIYCMLTFYYYYMLKSGTNEVVPYKFLWMI